MTKSDSGFTTKQLRHFQHAQAAAEMSDFKRARVGCVVVEGGKVLACGFSTHRSHTLQAKYDKHRTFRAGAEPKHSLHAEISAMSQLIDDKSVNWSRVEVYVYRACKDRPQGMARPCPACLAMLKDFRVRHVYYSTDIGYAYERIS